MASTTAKPSMTLPRNRNVGSLTAAIHCGQPRFDNPNSNPVLLAGNQHNRERELPDPVLKIRAEWIRAGKFAPNRHPDTWCVFPAIHVFFLPAGGRDVDAQDKPGHDESRNKPTQFMGCIRARPKAGRPRRSVRRSPGRGLKRRRHHNDCCYENRCCKVPPPCF